MIPLVRLREDLRFARELQGMVEVLKGATASQFRALQRKRRGFENYKIRLEEFLMSFDAAGAKHPFLKDRPHLPKAILTITSDDGFLGSLNSMVVSAALEQAGSSDEIIVMGERGARYLSESHGSAFTVLAGIGEDITHARASAVRNLLVSKFLSGKIGTVLVSFPRFLSLTVQNVEVTRLLPCADLFAVRSDPKKRQARKTLYLAEPTRSQVVDELALAHLTQKLYDIFWESKISEFAARIIHLEGSHEEILSANKKLHYEYFKHVHEKNDKNIREIFSSRLRGREGAAP